MGKRQWMWEKNILETVVSKKENTAGRKTKCQKREKKKCLCMVFNSLKKGDAKEGKKREEQAGGTKQFLLLTYIERSLSEDRPRSVTQPMKTLKCLRWMWQQRSICKNSQIRRESVIRIFFCLSLTPAVSRQKRAPVFVVLLLCFHRSDCDSS